jgi:hypothetical protein
MASIRAKVTAGGVEAADAIPEKYRLLRTIQLRRVGYDKSI